MPDRSARAPRIEQQRRAWIEQWQRSGLTVRAFRARKRLAEPSFYPWRRTLQQCQRDNDALRHCIDGPSKQEVFKDLAGNGQTIF